MPIDKYTSPNGDCVPDFSHAGYAGNEQPIPQAPVQVVVPSIEGDDGPRIQAAIDYVSGLDPDAHGMRGTVLLEPGNYEVAGGLTIEASGVVLRGSGPEEDGTVLTAAGRDRRTLIRLLGDDDRRTANRIQIEGYVPVGAYVLRLAHAGELDPGDTVMVRRPSTEEWIDEIGMSKFWRAAKAPRIWKAGELDIVWDRTVAAVDGKLVTLDAPLTMALDPEWGGGSVARYAWPGRVRQVGVESLRLVSAYDPDRPKDEDHAWVGVTMECVRDAWVRRVSFCHFSGSAVSVWESASRVTIADCRSFEPVSEDGGWRRHTFFTAGQQTLFLRCYSERGRHDFAVGHCAAGPNAFVHCDAREALGDSGPIGAWATGVLYDNVNIDGEGLRLGNRGTDLQFSGWTAANCLLWQSTAAQVDCYNPPTARNWAIGCWADFEGDGLWEAFNEFVLPKSLMRALVAGRVGVDAGKRIGDGIVHPPGSTRPSVKQAQQMVTRSNRPAPQLIDVIERSIRGQRLATDAAGARTIDTVLGEHPELITPEPPPATRRLALINGWLTVGGTLLTGRTMQTYWWRGRAMPQSLEHRKALPALTRFVPGRLGTGWTDDLESLSDRMVEEGHAAIYQHPGLWYDRRRQDHERVRRKNGEVWPPFDEQPFARSGRGKAWDGLSRYDLTCYNPWYFDRLDAYTALAERKGLLLLNSHYFQHNLLEAGAHWADFPWRSANNVNNTGFPEPPPYAGDKRIFQAHLFYDVDHPVRRKLHRAYIRHHLEELSDRANVIHMTSGEFTGSLSFAQFWLDTVAEWERETGIDVLTALSCPYDVQREILDDPARAAVVDVIDIRYWTLQPDGEVVGPRGGINLAPRQQGWHPRRRDGAAVAKAAREYRERFPDKAVIHAGESDWNWVMSGGSLPSRLPGASEELLAAIAEMKPADVAAGPDGVRCLAAPGRQYLVYVRDGKSFTLDLRGSAAAYRVRWVAPDRRGAATVEGETVAGGRRVEFSPPRSQDILLWLTAR